MKRLNNEIIINYLEFQKSVTKNGEEIYVKSELGVFDEPTIYLKRNKFSHQKIIQKGINKNYLLRMGNASVFISALEEYNDFLQVVNPRNFQPPYLNYLKATDLVRMGFQESNVLFGEQYIQNYNSFNVLVKRVSNTSSNSDYRWQVNVSFQQLTDIRYYSYIVPCYFTCIIYSISQFVCVLEFLKKYFKLKLE
jgi:hypothetical protein